MKARLLLAATIAALSIPAIAQDPFALLFQGSRTISCGTSSTETALATGLSGSATIQVEIQNKGSASPADVFIEFGTTGVVATVATGYPNQVGSIKLVSIPKSYTHVACISASGTQTVYVTSGRGQ